MYIAADNQGDWWWEPWLAEDYQGDLWWWLHVKALDECSRYADLTLDEGTLIRNGSLA